MENPEHGRPQQQGGVGSIEHPKQHQQFMQEQKGNDLAWRSRRRRPAGPAQASPSQLG
jgi:hypothetical protein